jgi:hypothetical protein
LPTFYKTAIGVLFIIAFILTLNRHLFHRHHGAGASPQPGVEKPVNNIQGVSFYEVPDGMMRPSAPASLNPYPLGILVN